MRKSAYQGKYYKKARLPLSVYLLYMLVATFLFTGVSFSQYVSTASGGDEARVAVMAAGVSVADIAITGQPGQNNEKVTTITVQNYEGEEVSEVALTCELSVMNLTNNLPLTFKFYDDAKLEAESNTVRFEPGVKGEKTFYLAITWPEDANDDSLAFEIDAVRVIAAAAQID